MQIGTYSKRPCYFSLIVPLLSLPYLEPCRPHHAYPCADRLRNSATRRSICKDLGCQAKVSSVCTGNHFEPSGFLTVPYSPPYGSLNEEVANYIQQTHGKTLVLWDLDSGDSQGGNEQDSVQFYFNLANQPNTTPHLTLSHETLDWATRAALNDGTVDALANKGFPLLTVAQCTDLPAYDAIGGYGTPDSSWHCGGTWTPTPPKPACKSTYISKAGDTCVSIENQFNLQPNTILPANTFLNCNDIWVGTPICVPDGPYKTTPPPSCKSTYISKPNDTCDSIENAFNLVAGTIKTANSFLTCNDIWTNTPICVPDGPYKTPQSGPGCTTQTYRNSGGETW